MIALETNFPDGVFLASIHRHRLRGGPAWIIALSDAEIFTPIHNVGIGEGETLEAAVEKALANLRDKQSRPQVELPKPLPNLAEQLGLDLGDL